MLGPTPRDSALVNLGCCQGVRFFFFLSTAGEWNMKQSLKIIHLSNSIWIFKITYPNLPKGVGRIYQFKRKRGVKQI